MGAPQMEEQAGIKKEADMAEELKQESGGKKAISTILKVILGLAFLVLGIMALISWRGALILLIKGSIGLFLILTGLIILATAKY